MSEKTFPRNRRRVNVLFWFIVIATWAASLAAVVLIIARLFPTNRALENGENPVLGAVAAQVGDAKMLQLSLHPYTGFHHPANADVSEVTREYAYHFTTNNYGFLTPYEMHPFNTEAAARREVAKGSGDRVVLLSGGSAAYGWGASRNEATISYVLESLLNRVDTVHHWRVVNLAMGGWIAYQEYIALDLYGTEFDADWIVLFDGRNDIFVPTMHGERVPNYLLFTGEKRLNDIFKEQADLSFWQRLPIFRYRRLAERLQRVSELPPPINQWDEAEKGVRFYLHTVGRIVREFQDKKVLVFTQPIADYSGIMGQGYALMTSELAKLPHSLPNMQYIDGTQLFPNARPGDGNFIDDCHLSDAGQASVAQHMAAQIMAREGDVDAADRPSRHGEAAGP